MQLSAVLDKLDDREMCHDLRLCRSVERKQSRARIPKRHKATMAFGEEG